MTSIDHGISTALDRLVMERALKLAEMGIYSVTPNPHLGCVVVCPGETVIGKDHLSITRDPLVEIVAAKGRGAIVPT